MKTIRFTAGRAEHNVRDYKEGKEIEVHRIIWENRIFPNNNFISLISSFSVTWVNDEHDQRFQFTKIFQQTFAVKTASLSIKLKFQIRT